MLDREAPVAVAASAGRSKLARRIIGWLGPDRSVTERVAMFSAVAVVGPSFEPGLQPRRTLHQALATGLVSAGTLLSVTLAQSSIESLGRIVTRRLGPSESTERVVTRVGVTIAVNAGAAVVGHLVARSLPAREDETLRRGLVRVVAERGGRTAQMTTLAASLVGVGQIMEDRWPRMSWVNRTPVALPAGVLVAAWHIQRIRGRMRDNGNTSLDGVSAFPSLGLAAGVAAGVWVLRIGERAGAYGVTVVVRRFTPGLSGIAWPIGHALSLGAFAAAVIAGYQYVIRRVEQGGSAVEPAYRDAISSTFVSGGPESLVDFESLSREGRRFANMALQASEIEAVMGMPAVADPIRVFVGLAAAPTIADRVALAIDELERTGAFDRSVLCLASPTGSGYINYVMSETLEALSLGDCATVTLQYSLRPSSLSLDRAETGVEQNTALLYALSGYLRGLPEERRPRLVLFGESLGAQTLLDCYRHRSVAAIDRDFITGSVFLGTPAATRFAADWRRDPSRVDPLGEMVEVDSFAEYEAIGGGRHVLVTHHDDPIPKFTPSLLVRQPEWLGDPDEREAGIPRSARWRPATTFVLTGIDMINAMEVVPGRFTRRGHDYREDIPDFVRVVFGLDATADQRATLEDFLREREVAWARKRVVAEQFARARESIERELKAWGVSAS